MSAHVCTRPPCRLLGGAWWRSGSSSEGTSSPPCGPSLAPSPPVPAAAGLRPAPADPPRLLDGKASSIPERSRTRPTASAASTPRLCSVAGAGRGTEASGIRHPGEVPPAGHDEQCRCLARREGSTLRSGAARPQTVLPHPHTRTCTCAHACTNRTQVCVHTFPCMRPLVQSIPLTTRTCVLVCAHSRTRTRTHTAVHMCVSTHTSTRKHLQGGWSDGGHLLSGADPSLLWQSTSF